MSARTTYYREVVSSVRWRLAEGAAERPASIHQPRDAAQLAAGIIGSPPTEHCVCIYLDVRGGVLGSVVMSIGTVSSSIIHPREVYGPALRIAASSVVVVHNHPTGIVDPSTEDRQVMRRLRDAGILLGVPLRDFLVVSAPGPGFVYWSAVETGSMVAP